MKSILAATLGGACVGAYLVFRRKVNTKSISRPEVSEPDEPDTPYRRLRRVETALRDRIGRVVIVVERVCDSHNYSAIIRTAEALGFQNILIVAVKQNVQSLTAERRNAGKKKATWERDDKIHEEHMAYGRRATLWVDVKSFQTTQDCIDYLKVEGFTIWVTDLSQKAVALKHHDKSVVVPEKLAVVMGTESTGISQEFVDAADKRVFIPMYGMSDSFNLSVAAALMMQQIIFMCPSVIGTLSDLEKHEIRKRWYPQMARTEDELEEYTKLVDTPPPPFRDTRRCDEHRTGFVMIRTKTGDHRPELYKVGR